MKKTKNKTKEFEDFFSAPLTDNQKSWGLIHDYYNLIMTYMEENNISQADLAKKIGKSRASISQLFKQTPNISLKRMVEIASAIGITLSIDSPEVKANKTSKVVLISPEVQNWIAIFETCLNQPVKIGNLVKKQKPNQIVLSGNKFNDFSNISFSNANIN